MGKMEFCKCQIKRWALPILGAILLLLLLTHKSTGLAFFNRYSGRYLLILIFFAMNIGLLWIKAIVQVSYWQRIRSISLFSIIFLVALLFSAIFLIDFMDKFTMALAPSEWVILGLIGGIILQAKALANKPNRILRSLAWSACSVVLLIILIEFLFNTFILTRLTPRTQIEFQQLMSSKWKEAIPLNKPEGTFRILGMSNSFGDGAGLSTNYHGLLEEILRRDVLPKTNIVNISVGGYNPRHELNLLRFAMQYSPDLVLHGFFVGVDFNLNEDQIYVFLDIGVRRNPNSSPYRPRNFLLRGWIERALDKFENRLLRRRELKNGYVRQIGTDSQQNFIMMQFKRMCYWGKRSEGNVLRLQRIFPVLDEIRSRAEKEGARYLLVIHPDQTQIDKELQRTLIEWYQIREDEYDLDLPSKILKAYCEDRGIPFLDLLPIFREQAKPQDLYLVRDGHYSQAGHELAAAAISQFLKNHSLLVGLSGKASNPSGDQ